MISEQISAEYREFYEYTEEYFTDLAESEIRYEEFELDYKLLAKNNSAKISPHQLPIGHRVRPRLSLSDIRILVFLNDLFFPSKSSNLIADSERRARYALSLTRFPF